MNCIDRHINYLISRHDCVIIPGWGAFIALYTPARIDAASGKLLPPTRSIGFNESLNHNDGLLASSLSRSEGIGYDEAVHMISEQVNHLRSQLNSGCEVSMGHIGTFAVADSGLILFQPFHTPVAAPLYYGLPEVSLTSLIQATKQEKYKSDSIEKKRRPTMTSIANRAMRIAASVALLLGLGIMLSTPVSIDKIQPSFASVTYMPSISEPKATSPSVLLPSRNEAVLYLASTSEGVAIADTASRNKYMARTSSERVNSGKSQHQPISPSLKIDDADPYCLIVASLATSDDADRYLRISKDKTLRCLEKDGKFRIYAATGATVAEALAPTRNRGFSERYPGAWVCHR